MTTSGDTPPAGACEVTDKLPDFALLALPENDLRRIDDHLAWCVACQAELADVLDVLAVLAMQTVPPPPASARTAFLARACNAAATQRLDHAAHVVCGEAQPDHRNAV